MTELIAMRHDPGGKVRLKMLPGVDGSAGFSACSQYRHWLIRHWGHDRLGAPYALWIGMNPSTAEADIDDPTIRREIAFTRAMGLDRYVKCNVMDYRATDPKRLLVPGVVPCSPENVAGIADLAKDANIVIAAWGALPRPLRRYANDVSAALSGLLPLYCMGMTADGSPRHPLYLRNDTKLILFNEPTSPTIGAAP